MGEKQFDLKVIKVTSPWDFLAVKKGNGASFSMIENGFQAMKDEMHRYFEQTVGQFVNSRQPLEGDICAAHRRESDTWQRVRIDQLIKTARGHQASCFGIDDGEQFQTTLLRIQWLPPKFREFPSQVRRCSLWGVQPLSLNLDIGEKGLVAKNQPCSKWDNSAVRLMRKLVEESTKCQAEIKDEDEDQMLYLRLYIHTQTGLICLNEKLIEEEYATSIEPSYLSKRGFDPDTISVSSNDNPTESSRLNDPQVNLHVLERHMASAAGDMPAESSVLSEEVSQVRHETSVPPLSPQRHFPSSGRGKALQALGLLSPVKPGLKTGSGRGLIKFVAQTKSPRESDYESDSSLTLRQTSNNMGVNESPSHKVPASHLSSVKINTSNEVTYGVGARPKGSSPIKVKSLKDALGLGSSGKVKRPKPSSGESSGNESSTKTEPLRTLSDSPMESGKGDKVSRLAPDHRDSRSGDSADECKAPTHDPTIKGGRRRYRRDLDPFVETTEENDRKIAEMRDSKDKYACTIEGDKILQALRNGSAQTARSNSLPMTTAPNQPKPSPYLGVICHGKNQPKMKLAVIDSPLNQRVQKIMVDEGVEYAQGMQGIVWPAISQGRHVVGISTDRQGKTNAYVPGIVSHLLDQLNYIDLPRGKGPQALVIVPSWKKAREIFEYFEHFSQDKLRVLVLYAGGTEDKEKTTTDLIRGCEILISTPNSLLRCLADEKTSLKRVCHIVMDDSEILATRFAEEIHDMMVQYKLVLKERKKLMVPMQVVVLGSEWSQAVDQFRLKYTKEALIVFASRVEAAVYGGVKQVVRMVRSDRKLRDFCGLLDSMNASSNGEKVIVFTENVQEALDMYNAAQTLSIYSLIIHENLEAEDTIEEARTRWLQHRSKELLVMVCTDRCFQDLSVTNATAVIHYGLPSSKTKFGNRLACMYEHFADRTQPAGEETANRVCPVSHIIVTEKEADKARSLSDVLQRCDSEMPVQFKDYLRGWRMGQENDVRKPLCPLLKAFGSCMNSSRCDHRHIVLADHDSKTGSVTSNTLPVQGEVRVKVLNVVNATRYWCNLVSHDTYSDSGGRTSTDLKIEYSTLTFNMAMYFGNPKNHTPFLPSADCFFDGLCGFKEKDGLIYRAKVRETRDLSSNMEVKVWLVDRAVQRQGTVDQLVQLPQDLADIPYQAIEVFACRIRPMDQDSEWTDTADLFAHQLVKGKLLTGRIVLRLGLTLWLEPLVHQVTLKNIGTANDLVIRQEFLANQLAVANPDHIPRLYELCRGKTEIPEAIMRKYFEYSLDVELLQETLTSSQDFHSVLIAAIDVDNPWLFYVQKWDTRPKLTELEDAMQARMSSETLSDVAKHKADVEQKLGPGSVCVAKSDDDQWYRGKIMSQNESGDMEIFCLDYGNVETVAADNIQPLPREFSKLPCQAIECQLAFVGPIGGKWSANTVDVMCDQAYDADGEKKVLYSKVIDRTDPHRSVGQRLVVDLLDTREVSFSQELVWRHLATCTSESHVLKTLVGKPSLKNQRFFNRLDKIPFLSANLYWAENEDVALDEAYELCELLGIRREGWAECLEQREVVPPALLVLGYLPYTAHHRLLMAAIAQLVLDSPQLCELLIDNNLIGKLVYCLEQVSRPSVQIDALQGIVQMLKQKVFLNAVCRNNQSTVNLPLVLSQFFNIETLEHETTVFVCTASATLIKESDNGDCGELKTPDMIELISKKLTQNESEDKKHPWLELLSAMALCTHLQPVILKRQFLDILTDLLPKLNSARSLYEMLAVLQCLVHDNRKHKMILLEHNLLIILNDMLDRGLPSPALEMCQQLQSAMTLQLPQQEVLAGVPAHIENSIHSTRQPQVTWMENCFRVDLTVYIRGASANDFELRADRLLVKCMSEGVSYELDWELFGLITPSKSSIKPYSSHTSIRLRKLEEGKWGRLLKQKIKPPCLTLDYEKVYDSDEEEIDDDGAQLSKAKYIFKDVPRDKVDRSHLRVGDDSGSEDDSDEINVFSRSDDSDPDIDFQAYSTHILRNARNDVL